MLTAGRPTVGCGPPLPPAAGTVPPWSLPPGWPAPDWPAPAWLPLGWLALGWLPPGWTTVTGPEAAGTRGVRCTPGRAEASVPPCGWAWQSPAEHWLPGMGALKCSTVRDMLAARNAATTTPRPAANVGVTTSLRSARLMRLP